MSAPRYRVVAIDETRNWDPAIVAITGRIAGVYVINFGEVTHVCSMRGSYWAEFLCNITERYVRSPDGYREGVPIFDETDDSDAVERGRAIAALWKGTFFGLENEGADESSRYVDEGFPEPDNSLIDMPAEWLEDTDAMLPEEAAVYRTQRDEAALEGARYLMQNGEEWSDVAPWNAGR